MKKRIILPVMFALTSTLITPIANAATPPEFLNSGKEENLNNHMSIISTTDVNFTKMPDGTPVAVTATAGYGSTINVIDLNTRKLIKHFKIGSMTKEKQQYASYSTGNGHVFIGFSNGELWDVDIVKGEGKLIEYPNGFVEPNFIWDVAEGENGNIYFGTYRSGEGYGTVFEYNVNTGKLRDFGEIDKGAHYVRSIAYYDGKVYAGMGTGPGHNGIIEIDVKDPSKKRPFYQDLDSKENDNIAFQGNLTAYNGYLYSVPDSSNYRGQVFVYDIKNDKWTDVIEGSKFMGNQVMGYEGNTVLMKNSSGYISQYNPQTQTLTPLVEKNINGSTRTSGLMDNKVYTFEGNGTIRSVDLKTKELIESPTDQTGMVGTERQIEAIHSSIGGEMFVAPFFPTNQIRSFNPWDSKEQLNKDDSLIDYAQQQVQFMDTVNDRWFISGAYPGGWVAITDRKDGSFKKVEIGNKQIRPTHATMIDDHTIAVTSSPDYGYPHGGVSIIDVEKGELLHFISTPNVAPLSITHLDGKVYVGTLSEPQRGDTPLKRSGKLIIIDAKTGQQLNEKVLLDWSRGVHNVLATKDGRLFATSNEAIYELDPSTGEVKKQHRVEGSGFYHPGHMLEAYDGIVIAKHNSQKGKNEILWIDPDDITQSRPLAEGYIPTVNTETGDLYYRKEEDKNLFRINYDVTGEQYLQPSYKPVKVKDGESVTIDRPLNDGKKLSEKTKFSAGKDFPSWAKLQDDGSIVIENIKEVEGKKYDLAVDVTYQDGSKETITAPVIVESDYVAPKPSLSTFETPTSTKPEENGQDTSTSSSPTSEEESSISTSGEESTIPSGNTSVTEENSFTTNTAIINEPSVQSSDTDRTVNIPEDDEKESSEETLNDKERKDQDSTSVLSRKDGIVEPTQQDKKPVVLPQGYPQAPSIPFNYQQPQVVSTPGTFASAGKQGAIVDTGGHVEQSIWSRIVQAFKLR